ncbi:hypothetical protein CDI07_07975 [Thermococcus sp. 5-4]|nr:hypothetical protein CDI07_07975 [Thermococcus sp. 5-4]
MCLRSKKALSSWEFTFKAYKEGLPIKSAPSEREKTVNHEQTPPIKEFQTPKAFWKQTLDRVGKVLGVWGR